MQLKYRPEVDGLRTLAVFPVVIYHANIVIDGHQLAKGGFIGVDVFFVISGYLITSIILRELRSNIFSIASFYERRARRILPVLFLVLSVSTWLAWKYTLPDAFQDFSASLISAIGFGSNIWFMLESTYAAEESIYKPLLHTWSLSVEEQFYLIYPVMLLAIWKLFRRYLFVLMSVGMLVSLQYADFASHKFPGFNFYSLLTRGWELLAGALLARMEIEHGRSNVPVLSKIMPVIGGILILHSVVSFDDEMRHPSFLTLQPVLGAVILIWFMKKGEWLTNLLSTGLFVGLGVISYSFYLWHVPIFSFGKIINPSRTNIEMFGFILFALALSVATYFVIEKPFRSRMLIGSRLAFGLLLISGTALIAVNSFVIFDKGIPGRFGGYYSLFARLGGNETFKIDGQLCGTRPVNEACTVRAKSGRRDIVVIGDSHAEALSKKIYDMAKINGFGFKQFSKPACMGVRGLKRTGNPQGCIDHSKDISKYLAQSEPAIIIYSGRFPVWFHRGRRFNNQEGGVEDGKSSAVIVDENEMGSTHTLSTVFKERFLEWAEYGHKVFIIYPIPEVGWDVPNLVKSKLDKYPLMERFNEFRNISITTSYQVYKKRTKSSITALDLVGDHQNIVRIYPAHILCSNKTNRCITHSQNAIYYFDDDHLVDREEHLTH